MADGATRASHFFIVDFNAELLASCSNEEQPQVHRGPAAGDEYSERSICVHDFRFGTHSAQRGRPAAKHIAISRANARGSSNWC